MAGLPEASRQRIAWTLIGVSIGLILLGFGLILRHMAVQETLLTATTQPAIPKTITVKAVKQVLFLTLILVLVFAVSTLAFMRWSRHFRKWMFHKPQQPSPSADVWAMHKLPEGAIQEWSEEGDSNSPPEK